jgi:TniQ protein
MRLLFRVDPLPGESPRGYLCRVAHEHGYSGPLSLAQIAGLPRSGLERDDNARLIAHVLRLETEEWRGLCYRHINGPNRFDQRLFYGERISAYDLNYRRPRICPLCLRECPVWWAVWDLGLITACPLHRCHLLNQCPACKRSLAWQRPAVHQCRCGLDFRTITPEPATSDLIAINAAMYRAAGFSPGADAEHDLKDSGFPPGMLGLKLGDLLRFILFVGAIREKDGLRQKQRPFGATDLVAATEIDLSAVVLLRDWPRPLREVLRHMLPPEPTHPAALNFSAIFGNFYRHVFRVLPRSDFGFLHDLFERFAIEDWKGLIRGQHRYFSAVVRQNSPWVAAGEAERIARTGGGKVLDAVHQGHLEALFVTVRPGGSRTECWIRRDSLNRWIAARDAELARYMLRREAKRLLGLTNATILKVAAAGAIRCVEGPEQNFPTGFFFFLREDVMKIKQAFEKNTAPAMECANPDGLLTLRHAIKNYLGRDSALAAVIQAVVDGSLVPVGHASKHRGITGYLFRAEDLRRYRPLSEAKARPEAFLNFGEAATVLGVRSYVVRGLVEKGFLTVAAGFRHGLSKLIPEKEIQRFAECYVPATIVGKRFKLSACFFARYLRQSGTPLLAVPISDKGKGDALFLRRDTAAHFRFRLLY